ncbi:MAG: hypothetical protein H0V82_12225 [Candidatus Protochlamydia sp.]|nr:hypothetical protein [Candidatus Protochlamydia sp.]
MTPSPGLTQSNARLSTLIKKENDFKAFINQDKFSPYFFHTIGSVFTAGGIGVMCCSKQLQPATFGAPFIFGGGIIITLLGMASLYAGNQVNETQQYIKVSQNAIQQYEQVGDYATALKIARDSYEESFNLGLTCEAADFSSVKRLEAELLALGSSRLLFDENYQPRAKLLQLLEIVGMEQLNKSEKAVVQINNWAQKNLLRQGERWQEQTSKFETLKLKIKPLLIELGFINASSPHFKEYQGAIVHGSLLQGVRLRLQYLVEQWKQGIRFSHLYFLSGERPLEAQQENEDLFMQDKDSPLKIRKGWSSPIQFPKTECEMMQLVWDQSEIPEEMRKEVQTYFINAPMKKDMKSSKLLRPTTDDTVEYWLKTAPLYGRYLAVTNAPYANRQDLVVRALSPSDYSFETIASGAGEQEKMAILLDELARIIYQTKRLSEK